LSLDHLRPPSGDPNAPIRRALEHCDGRRAETARRLGITREGLYKL
jgi:DNA-binding NtrC family response regulator